MDQSFLFLEMACTPQKMREAEFRFALTVVFTQVDYLEATEANKSG